MVRANVSTRAVLPIPASPVTNTNLTLSSEHFFKPAVHPRQGFSRPTTSMEKCGRSRTLNALTLLVAGVYAGVGPLHLTDEAITSTMCGFNETWRLWIVAESLANLTNQYFEDGIADKCSRPDRIEEIIFGDELTRTPKEMVKYCKGFGPQLDCLRPSPQLLVRQIEAKGIEHYAFFVPHYSPTTLPKLYGRLMTRLRIVTYCRSFGKDGTFDGWMAIQVGFRDPVSPGNRY